MPAADSGHPLDARPDRADWWRDAVVYQCYLRSFADSDGDGIGDLPGLRARLGHLESLGVDALWINPCYPSPQHDAGYDVADYRDVEPTYGTPEDLQGIVDDAHSRGLRVLLDIVPNHTSEEHPWFREALAGDPAARARYIFRPGRGEGGAEPPNDWQSNFGGPAWTRTTGADGEPGEWYLHLFAPEQPDLDWTNDEVVAEFEDVLRFWFDRGVDGFRIDVAHGLAKTPGLPDAGPRGLVAHNEPHPAWDQDDVHEIYRGWRRVGDAYDPPRVFVAEAWPPSNERLGHYVRPDELHGAFEFDFLRSPFDADVLRRVLQESLGRAQAVGAPVVWVLANHDVVRQVTRYSRRQPEALAEASWERQRWATDEPGDRALGTARARAMLLLELALPGSVYLYQGEELGLPEFEDVPDHRREDPMFEQSAGEDPGRDGARVPMPWRGSEPPYGFSTATETWLPQPGDWGTLTAAAQEDDPDSTLQLYRAALARRREAFAGGEVVWQEPTPGILAFRRGDVECRLNTSTAPVDLPAGEVLLASAALPGGGVLPPDTAAWVRTTD